MHLLLPFAGAAHEAAAQAASSLSLPHLERLLALLTPTWRDDGDALSLSPPHERALATLWGWSVTDGLLPFAAHQAAHQAAQHSPSDAVPAPAAGAGMAFVQPVHWHLGTEQLSLADPATLDLHDDEARALFDALKPLADEDGFALHFGDGRRWYASHPSFATLPTASLDRVIGRNVDLWLNSHPDARRVRRLQAEAQMLWHTHPVNAEREAQGVPAVNSFWLSGTGPTQAAAPVADLQIDDRLRAPALSEDWQAWAEAFVALDAGPLRQLLERAGDGQPATLTLCGESNAQRWEQKPRSWHQRLLQPRRAAAAPILQRL